MEQRKKENPDAVADQAPYFFHQGTTTRAYEYLGVHRLGERVFFRVWAPNAEAVSVVGDFNGWDRGAHPMERITARGIWELCLDASAVAVGQCYKYCIRSKGRELLKSDPYAVCMECPPKTSSVISEPISYQWRDAGWMRYRKKHYTRERIAQAPLNIYELHAGSWRRHEDGSYYTYRELAASLTTYVKQMGYTHVELMPLFRLI